MKNKSSKAVGKAFRYAAVATLPILAGFLFLGMTYGIYMNSLSFFFVYPMAMSTLIFAGSAEFVAANPLVGAFNPIQALTLTLMINARHIFYGISMPDRYKGTGWKKPYLIFGMCESEKDFLQKTVDRAAVCAYNKN